MSYELIEMSEDNGHPDELYEIKYSTRSYHYTSTEIPIVFNGNTYVPEPISRSDWDEQGDATRSNLTIRLPKTNVVAELFKVQPPSEIVTVTIYGVHDADESSGFMVKWKGRIVNTEWGKSSIATITCESLYTSLLRFGITPRFSKQCIVALFSPRCGVNREDFKFETTITAKTGNSVTIDLTDVPSTDANYFAGGLIKWQNNVNENIESRGVRSSEMTTGVVTLTAAVIALSVGDPVTIYPGCNHATSHCRNRFNNIRNYRGFHLISNKNPFGTSSLF